MPQAQFLDIPTWGSALGDFGSSFLDEYRQKQQQSQQEDALQQLMQQTQGMDPEDAIQQIFGAKGVPFEQKKTIAQVKRDAQVQTQKKQELAKKREEEIEGLGGALETVDRMRDIRANGRLGILSRGTQFFPGGEDTRKDRGEYAQLGKSLISYATNIPIRNKFEFEVLAKKLHDPNITDAEAEGVLDAMERILNNALSSKNQTRTRKGVKGKKREISSFLR